MSWSINLVGKPENVAKALQAHSEKLEGMSKQEFDAALPSMVNLVNQNHSKTHEPVIEFSASGHAYSQNGEIQNSNCSIVIKPIPGVLV